MTASLEDIIDYLNGLGTVHGLINNSNLGDDTDIDIIQQGAKIVTEAGRILGIPIIATTVDEKFAKTIGEKDCAGNPIRVLKRYMVNTYW
jgi:hypothetical protein